MQKKFIKIVFIIFSILNQSTVYSKVNSDDNFNHKYLSNYFSALLSHDNHNNDKALRFFNSSKSLLNKHDEFLREYVYSLVEDGQVAKAIKQIKHVKNKNSTDFFESKLIILLDSIQKKNFSRASKDLSKLENFRNNSTYEYIIYETLKSYINLFLLKTINNEVEDFGKLSLITSAFQNCYLNTKKTNSYFAELINSIEGDYSRYLFFYLGNLVENKDFDYVKKLSLTIDPLSNGLLILQAKDWIDKSNFKNFKDYFSCKSETDILAEFFYLISNLYSSQEEYEKSNFYLNISYFLNPKFYFNLSLIAENHYLNKNFDLAKKIYKKFEKKHEVFQWYKTKKIGQIIEKKENNEIALMFVEKNFNQIKNPSIKVIFDLANIYKRFKKYNKSIELYSIVLSKLEKDSESYANTLYRRGGCYERLKDFKNADKDLLKSLEISPEDPYVMNYLAYSWLERNYKIKEAINMLDRAYEKKKNDPYIIDSVGWGYYLIGDYENAEKYIKQAVLLMPDDPIVNDHYGDILWKLERKLQAKYFWENVLNMDSTEEEMKKKILEKLIIGLDKI